MFTKKFYVSGGNFHELQAVFANINGVLATRTGYIDASVPNPVYEEVVNGKTAAVMGVEIVYNPKKIDISTLMDILFSVINPYAKDKQGACEGRMYRSGVYYVDGEDEAIVDLHMNFIRNRQQVPAATDSALTVNDPASASKQIRRCYAEASQLKNFYAAEAVHQHYLRHNPQAASCIDLARLQELKIINRVKTK